MTVEGMTFTRFTWSKITGLGNTTIYHRLGKGMPPFLIVTKGAGPNKPDLTLDELRERVRVYTEAKAANKRPTKADMMKEARAARALAREEAKAIKAAELTIAKAVAASKATNAKVIEAARRRQLKQRIAQGDKLAAMQEDAERQTKKALAARTKELKRIQRARQRAAQERIRQQAAEARRLEEARKTVAAINAYDQRMARKELAARQEARRKEAARRRQLAKQEKAHITAALRAEAHTRGRVRQAQIKARETMRRGIDPRRPSYLYTTCILGTGEPA